MPNWLYLTGTTAQLQQVWRHYGVAPAEILPAGSMIGHGDYAFVIDQAGHLRQELDFDTGPGNPGHQVVVRGRTDRRRPPAAGALMSRPARSAGGRGGLGRRGADRGLRQRGPRRARPRGRGAAGRGAVPGHVPRHRRRHLGRRGDGRLRSPRDNNFWQLFVRPAGSRGWKLVTPRGTADNGGLVLAAGAGPSLITGFRPSQYLTYTPLTSTADGGQAWSSTGPLDGTLANVPDALAGIAGHRAPPRPACQRHR